jgi:hypothetical protein
LPLVLVVLLRRITIPGMLLMLVLIGTASFWQVPFLQLDKSGAVQWHLMICINVGTSLVMLSLLIAIRLNGYSLVATRPTAKA